MEIDSFQQGMRLRSDDFAMILVLQLFADPKVHALLMGGAPIDIFVPDPGLWLYSLVRGSEGFV